LTLVVKLHPALSGLFPSENANLCPDGKCFKGCIRVNAEWWIRNFFRYLGGGLQL
jgi:hypothetical protein